MEGLYALKWKAIWQQFWSEHFSFWMICGYLFVEYVRPQSIFPSIDVLPWASTFLLLSLIGLLVAPEKRWVKYKANKWMVAFLIVILLSSWNAFFPEISYKHLEFFYTWLIIYFLIVNIVNTQKRFFIFLSIFVIASFKLSLSLAITWAKRGFGFTTWGLAGPPGFFQNSGELAIQMCVFFPIAYFIAARLKPHVSRRVFFILALMPITAALVILGSSSRGGQIALVVQSLFMFYRQIFRPKTLISICMVGFLLFSVLPEEQKARFRESGTDNTSQQRLNYWQGGLRMLNAHPVLGVGYFNFSPYFEVCCRDLMLLSKAELPHNIFVQMGADLGYSGLFIYAMLINSCFLWRKKSLVHSSLRDDLMSDLPRAFNVSIVGFLIAGQFVTVGYYPFMWIHLAFVASWNNIFVMTKRLRN